MATVHTDLGPGEIIASETVRGRTSHRVAGNGFEKWFDEAEIGFVHEAGRHEMPDHPGKHRPGPDFDPRVPAGGFQVQDAGDWLASHPEDEHVAYRQAWAPVDHDNSVALPYDPTPQYPAIPGDTESTIQPIHEIDADERLSPADSITFKHRSDDESELEPTGPNFEGGRTSAWNPSNGLEPGDEQYHQQWMSMNPGSHPDESPYYDGGYDDGAGWNNSGGAPALGGFDQIIDGPHQHSVQMSDHRSEPSDEQWSDVPGHMANVHEGFAFLLPLAEGLMGAGGGAAAAGAAESAGAGAIGQGVARGVGSAATHEMMGGGGDDGQGGGGDPTQKFVDATSPGEGWGPLQVGASLDNWLASHEVKANGVGAGLSDRYIDVTASADYHNDPVAQFRHDPHAFIQRIGHVEDEPVSAEMEHYGQLIEANPQIREAAWSDVRAKAMRLRREGKIDVKDVAPDRIYASVEGDHGTYDVMIAKEGAFGGFGGGHAISNWRCGCEWGRWAFQRRLTYVGRLCSHGYATYMTMQSAHMKNQPRQKKLTRPVYKRADALQNEPQRLVPELVINDTDDDRAFLDVTKDERKDTGPDDIVSEQDIVHFARVMDYCDRHQYPYPRELTAFLVRHADDQTEADWKVEDASKAIPALEEIRDWSDTPISEDLGHAAERNDQVRDAVDKAREEGTDASLFTAGVGFREAGPGDPGRPIDKRPYGDAGQQRDRQQSPILAPSTMAPNGGKFAPQTQPAASGAAGAAAQSRTPAPSAPSGSSDPDAFKNMGRGTPATPVIPNAPGAPVQSPSDRANSGTAKPIPGSGVAQAGGAAAANPAANGVPGNKPSGGGPKPVPGAEIADKGGQAGGSAIGQGEYKIQQGDTLSDIAQRAGYGGDYKALGDANNIKNYDKINAGDTINIGRPGGDNGKANPAGAAAGDAGGGGADTPKASANPSTNAAGGPLNQNSGGAAADSAGAALNSPANTNPALNNPATATPKVDLSATGTGGAGGAANAGAGAGPASPAKMDTSTNSGGAGDAGTPKASDTGSPGASGAGANPTQNNDAMSQFSSAMNTAGDVASTVKSLFGSVMASQSDYDEWVRYAYPDSPKTYDHKPFNGSGGDPSIEFSSSEGYADKARKDMDDVWDLEHHNVNETDARFRNHEGGIRRAGRGNTRPPVTPEVVREQRIAGRQDPTRVEAAMEEFASFDPLAARTPDDFLDGAEADQQAIYTAANTRDIVAEFQRQADAGGSAINAAAGSGGQFDDFANSPAVRQAMMRTAGRNYSLAEQHELIREGDIGGAGNLGSLQLAGTHYETEMRDARDSVGLW